MRKSLRKSVDDMLRIYNVIKIHSGKRIGKIYYIYRSQGGAYSYKTFQRKVDFLSRMKLVTKDRMFKGGNTTVLRWSK
jgi:hypothetical protein